MIVPEDVFTCFITKISKVGTKKWFEWETDKSDITKKIANLTYTLVCYVLKTRSEKIVYWFCRFSILLGFFMSKKQERLRSELLSEDKITNLLGFLTYLIKPRRIENLQSQLTIFPDPAFNFASLPLKLDNPYYSSVPDFFCPRKQKASYSTFL